MRRFTWLLSGLAGLSLLACATPPEPPPPAVTIGLRDAMLQAVDALAAARAHAARAPGTGMRQRGLRACGAEAVFHVMALPATGPDGTAVAHLVLVPPEGHDGAQASTVTLTLAAEDCDAPEPAPARRR